VNQPTTGASLCKPPGKSVRQDAAKIVEPKLGDTQCGFCRGYSSAEQISTLRQIFEKYWEHATDLQATPVLLTSGKYMAGFLAKSFWGCCGSTVLTCWPSSSCILAQKIVSLFRGVNSQPFSDDVGLLQWCVLSPLFFIVYTRFLHSPHYSPRAKFDLRRHFTRLQNTFCQ